MSVKLKKTDNSVSFYVDNEQILTISTSELEALTSEVKQKLLLYGTAVLLQRETAGVKEPNRQKEKILQRWGALQEGKWKVETKRSNPREAMKQTQLQMLKALPKDQARAVIESLRKNNALLLNESDLRALGLA